MAHLGDLMTDQSLKSFAKTHPFVIVYNGECPFCSAYVRFLRLKRSAGDVELIDAREEPQIVQAVRDAGYEINDGMMVLDRGQVFYGENAMHVLALMSTPAGIFNRATAWVFARPKLARLVYPVFKLGRRIALALLRKPMI